jgi:hypothetical protein
MTPGARYGDVALGVESALPVGSCTGQSQQRIGEWISRLMSALRRWS